MIEANELRIGNWLFFKNMITPNTFIQVDAWFMRQLVNDINDKNPKVNGFYQPIPLTPKRLEKLGFSNYQKLNCDFEENGLYILHNEVIIHSYKDGKFYYGFLANDDDNLSFGIEIKSVHQLQNLIYALTGEELTYQP